MRLIGALLLLLGGLSGVAAQTLAIDGDWGNEAGCRYIKTGDVDGDDHLVLTADRVESYGTGCTWVEVLTAKGGEQVGTGLCGYEGESSLGVKRFIVLRDGADAGLVRILSKNGEPWGEVRKCP